MNPFDIFNEKEINNIKEIENVENREYSKEEFIALENKLAQNIIYSSKNSDRLETVDSYALIDKIERSIKK